VQWASFDGPGFDDPGFDREPSLLCKNKEPANLHPTLNHYADK